MRKIGIMGGTFDPIHIGHLMLAEWAAGAAGLDETWIVPTGISYQKAGRNVLPGQERLRMAELAVEGNEKFRCLDVEVSREGYTYSYETLEQLRLSFPNCTFYFIMGADCLYSMERWKYPEKIFQNAILLAAARGDVSMDRLRDKRQELLQRYGGEIQLLPFLPLPISSSIIRERIQNGLSVRYMVPDKVLSYIEEKRWYLDT